MGIDGPVAADPLHRERARSNRLGRSERRGTASPRPIITASQEEAVCRHRADLTILDHAAAFMESVASDLLPQGATDRMRYLVGGFIHINS